MSRLQLGDIVNDRDVPRFDTAVIAIDGSTDADCRRCGGGREPATPVDPAGAGF
jgi:hypothetical protein